MGYQFFQNKDCEFFPCHQVGDKEEFNCLFCFCPLYTDVSCGGNYSLLINGVKDCTNCLVPHFHYKYVIDKLSKNMEDFTLKLQIKYHSQTLNKIEKIEQGDWIDLRAAETVTLSAGEFKLISLGISVKLPEGYEAHVVPRSSTFKNWGILQTNSMGIIDESYSGNNDIWRMPVYATRDVTIEENDRICQFRIMPKMAKIDIEEVLQLTGSDRGGFGSTGQR